MAQQTERSRKMAEKKAANQASAQRIAEAKKVAVRALQVNECPQCGQPVRQNLALAGWVQCIGVGADGFRAAGAHKCSWQGFC